MVNYLKTFDGLMPIGRYGAFKYNNQDHSILMGLLAAENILKARATQLWAVNTDYSTYQEAAVITKTGLEVQSKPEPKAEPVPAEKREEKVAVGVEGCYSAKQTARSQRFSPFLFVAARL